MIYRQQHQMVGNLFPKLSRKEDLAQYELTDDEVAEYMENGFVAGRKILDDHQIKVLRESLEGIRTGTNPRISELYEIDADYVRAPDQNVFHFLGAWMIDEAFHDILFHPSVTVPISQLLQTQQVRFWHDQVFYKPPKHPGVVTWHQDYSYWTRSVPAGHITCWIGLDDSTLESGCVQFVPGSHKWDLLPKISLTKDMDKVKEFLTPEQSAQFKQVPMIRKAGECSFHHCMTMHGSYGNNADHPRRAIVLNYMLPDRRSADSTAPCSCTRQSFPRARSFKVNTSRLCWISTC